MKETKNKIYFIVIVALVMLTVSFFFPNETQKIISIIKKSSSQFASVILSHNFRSIAEIKSHYVFLDTTISDNKVRILIVPGHEPDFGGAEFGGVKEREMNVVLGQALQKFLTDDPHFHVFITRDSKNWSPDFMEYFKNNWSDIVKWTKASSKEFSRMVNIGSIVRTYSTVKHTKVDQNIALRLYGITKWSNENKIDIEIHIHFNDHPRLNIKKAGDYSGFAIYVPSTQYGNSTTTKTIADSIFNRLARYNQVSNLPEESIGVIDEPELSAVGANNTADSASVLIEYGYIYEKQFQDAQTRDQKLKELAFQTYLGLKDFFEANPL